MTSIRKSTRTLLDALRADGAQPKKLKTTEAIGVQSGRRVVTLVDSSGEKTAAGLYWEQKSGTDLPAGGFLQQAAERNGNVETIRLRDGRKAVTRRWDAATGEYKFTALGKKYYSTLRRNYVVDVPVVIKGKRKDGTTYQIKSHLKMEKLGLRPVQVPLHLSLEERRAYVKASVKRSMEQNPNALYEVSDEQWWYDDSDSASWAVHEETVGVDPLTREGESHVVLDRSVGARPMRSDAMLFPDAVCPEAFVESDDRLCVPRQIAAILQEDMGEICHALTEACQAVYGRDNWENGATARMIMEFCKKRGFGCVVVHCEEVIETLQGSPILAFTIHEDHAYFYKDLAVRKALARRNGEMTARMRKVQKQSQTPPAAEWEEFNGEIRPGHFWVFEDSIASVRASLLQQGRNPKVVMKDEIRIRTLICKLRNETCQIHSLPEHRGDLEAWLKRLDVGITYKGEGLPALSLKVLQTLVRRSRERTWLTTEEKALVLEAHGHCCAICGSKGGAPLEFDHVARFSESYQEQVFQPLCAECHREKTTRESRTHDGDELASYFEKEVWTQYVQSPRLPPLVARLRNGAGEGGGAQVADVIRCRRSALLYNVHPLPVFCPLDDIRQRTTPDLGDLCFVTRPLPARSNFASFLGYTGPGWMHRILAEWLLHTAVITWEDITHTLTATAHLPAGILAEPLEKMEAAWDGDRTLAKTSVNSLIGLWAIDEATSLKVRTSRREDDAPPQGCLTSTFHYEGGFVYDFLTRTKLITNASCRPLHDLCLSTEAVRVGQMLLAIKVAGAIPYELKTDSVLFKPKKKSPVQLGSVTFRDLDMLYCKAYPIARPSVQLVPVCSSEHPFRQAPATEKDPLKVHADEAPKLFSPSRNATLQVGCRATHLVPPDEGERRVLAGESLLVLGIAGTGKTTYCKGIVERLRAAGEKVDVVSKTHVASRRAGGVTLDHWVRKHVVNGCPQCTVLYVDEVSQIDVGLLLQLAKLTYAENIRFILSGDFNQFAPIGNNFRGAPIAEDAFQKSNLLHTMCSGNVVHLTQCRRSDKVLFDFYASLVGDCPEQSPLKDTVKAAKALFCYDGLCERNLVISHKKRILINKVINEQLAPKDAVRLEVNTKQPAAAGNCPQSILIWPGIQLLGAVPTERRGIRNSCLYEIAEVNTADDTVRLVEPNITLTFEQVLSWLRLAYAQTYASVQGTEFDCALRLHDASHCFFTRRHLFVGLSRAKCAATVSVVD